VRGERFDGDVVDRQEQRVLPREHVALAAEPELELVAIAARTKAEAEVEDARARVIVGSLSGPRHDEAYTGEPIWNSRWLQLKWLAPMRKYRRGSRAQGTHGRDHSATP